MEQDDKEVKDGAGGGSGPGRPGEILMVSKYKQSRRQGRGVALRDQLSPGRPAWMHKCGTARACHGPATAARPSSRTRVASTHTVVRHVTAKNGPTGERAAASARLRARLDADLQDLHHHATLFPNSKYENSVLRNKGNQCALGKIRTL